MKRDTARLHTYREDRSLTAFQHHNHNLEWPAGSFALPEPRGGCPYGPDINWKHGYRLFDQGTGSSFTTNTTYINNHLNTTASSRYLTEQFCTKSDPVGRNTGLFPEGNYCIYRTGETCPAGFSNGTIRFYEDQATVSRTWSHVSGIAPKCENINISISSLIFHFLSFTKLLENSSPSLAGWIKILRSVNQYLILKRRIYF